jgi:nucleoid-associated protein YgaU
MNQRIVFSIAIVLGLVVIAGAPAQNLLTDNPHYERAQELKRQAEQAIEQGDYDQAEQYTQQARQKIQDAREWASRMLEKYKANGWINVAERRMTYAQGVNAQERYPEEYQNASQFFDQAQELFAQESYQESIQAARNTISALQNVEPPQQTAEADRQQASEQEDDETLPRYYTVRLIPERRDCFWRIAEYEFVYDDPWKWRKLYEANKEKLADPANPDLIHPGTVLRIPSIDGEEREGMWNPENELPEDAK